MAEHIDRLGLDASSYIAEVDRTVTKINALNNSLRSMKTTLSLTDDQLSGFELKVKETLETGEKWRGSIKEQDGVLKAFGQTSIEITGGYEKLIQAQKDAMAGYNAEQRVTKELAAVRKQLLSADNAEEEERRTKILAEQQRLYDKLVEDNRRMIQYEKERKAVLEGQLANTKAINDASAKSLANAQAQSRLARQAQSGQILGGRLREQFLQPVIDAGGATPQQLTTIQNRIDSVVNAVQSGAIRASRANQIIQQAIAGQPQVLTGIENRVQGIGTSIVTATRNVQTGGQQIQQAFHEVEDGANGGGRSILNFANATRILTIQLLHTAISAFIGQLRESVQAAEQFAIRVGEIQTISQKSGLSFEQWTSSVRALSDEFGNPILDTAEGVYETISNQIAKGADASAFMAKAMELARVAVSSTADSVNSLSSVINAYNLTTADTDRISGILFKTVDLGRIRLSDMGTSLGRITPLASHLGISFEELSAGIATLTIKGITPSESLTALNAVMSKLLNPTKEMKELFASWGVASGQAAVSTFGFEGVLRKVIDATNSGKSSFAELFNEIRATRGGLGLTQGDLEGYSKTLNDITNNSQADFIQAQKIINDNIGINFQVELNKVKNFFIEDFGKGIIGTLLGLGTTIDATGKKTGSFVDVLKTLISFGKILATTYIAARVINFAFGAATQFVTARLAEQAATANLLGPAIEGLSLRMVALRGLLASPWTAVGAVVGFGIVTALFEEQTRKAKELQQQYENIGNKVSETVAKETEDLSRELAKQKADFDKNLDERIKSYERYAAAFNTVSDQITKDQNKILKAVGKEIDDAFSIYIKNAESALNKLEAQSNKALSNIERANARIQNLKDDLAKGAFENRLKLLPEDAQVDEIKKKIQDLVQTAQAQAAKAQTLPAGKESDAALNESEKAFKEASDLNSELFARKAKAQEKFNELTAREVELRARLKGDDDAKRAQSALQDETRTQAQRRVEGKKTGKQQAEDDFNHKNALKDQLAQVRDINEQRKDQAELAKLDAEKAKQEAITKAVGEQKDLQDQQNKLRQTEINSLQAVATAMDAQAKQTRAAADAEQKRLESVKDIFQEIGKFKLPKEIDKENIDDLKKQIDETFDKGIKASTDPDVIAKLVDQRERLLEEAARRFAKFEANLQQDNNRRNVEDLKKRKGDLDKQIQDAANKGSTGVNTLKETASFIENLLKNKGVLDKTLDIKAQDLKTGIPALDAENERKRLASNDIGTTGQRFIDQFNSLIETFTKEIDPKKKALEGQAILKQLLNVKELFGLQPGTPLGTLFPEEGSVKGGIAGDKTVANLTDQISKAISESAGATDTQNDLTKQAAKLASDLADAQAKLVTPMEAANTGLQQLGINTGKVAAAFDDLIQHIPLFGQPQQHEFGGWARGTDRIPAMLTEGEFVVNARSAKKYWKELMQINWDTGPIYRANGGPVSQVSGFGSIGSMGLGSRISFGDTNVTITPHPGQQVDARAIAYEITRLQRQGLVK